MYGSCELKIFDKLDLTGNYPPIPRRNYFISHLLGAEPVLHYQFENID